MSWEILSPGCGFKLSCFYWFIFPSFIFSDLSVIYSSFIPFSPLWGYSRSWTRCPKKLCSLHPWWFSGPCKYGLTSHLTTLEQMIRLETLWILPTWFSQWCCGFFFPFNFFFPQNKTFTTLPFYSWGMTFSHCVYEDGNTFPKSVAATCKNSIAAMRSSITGQFVCHKEKIRRGKSLDLILRISSLKYMGVGCFSGNS